jgi:hypothetical protein
MASPLLAKYARNGAPGRVGEREGGDGEFVLRGINSRLSTGRRVYRLVYLGLRVKFTSISVSTSTGSPISRYGL